MCDITRELLIFVGIFWFVGFVYELASFHAKVKRLGETSTNNGDNDMSFKLTINPALEAGDNTISITYSTIEDVRHASDNIADLLLFLQDTIKVMPDYSNIFVIEEYIDGEWVEIE